MRDSLIFRYEGIYYRCVALLFGWGRSNIWFAQYMAVFSKEMRQWGYRVLNYIVNLLIAPASAETASNIRDCKTATRKVIALLRHIGIRRQQGKGEWSGTRRLEHLVVMVVSSRMRFSVTLEKAEKVMKMSR